MLKPEEPKKYLNTKLSGARSKMIKNIFILLLFPLFLLAEITSLTYSGNNLIVTYDNEI